MTWSLPCPTCGEEISNPTPHGEVIAAGAADGAVLGAQRMFLGQCRTCGPRIFQHPHMGHHSTHGEALLRRRYPKPLWRLLKAHLEPADRRRFTDALHGRVHPKDEDVSRWDAAAVQAGATLVTRTR